ncbi:MAG: NADH-quinone oxidoreductase subunit J [Armatimonadota bacterium]
MSFFFLLASAIAVFCTVMVVTRLNAVHALLYLIISLMAVAVDFYLLGAHFVAALEVIIYAGAIMVLFVFVIMMLNLGPHAAEKEGRWITPGALVIPILLSFVLLGEMLFAFTFTSRFATTTVAQSPQRIGEALFGPYVLGVELASLLLLAGMVGAYHLGRRMYVHAPVREADAGNEMQMDVER